MIYLVDRNIMFPIGMHLGFCASSIVGGDAEVENLRLASDKCSDHIRLTPHGLSQGGQFFVRSLDRKKAETMYSNPAKI